jgi:hypothetical protein
MGNRKYPRLGSLSKSDRVRNKECDCCDQKATHLIDVQWDYMRGNDDVAKVCDRHAKLARVNFDKMMAHMRSKESYLNRKKHNEKPVS